MRVLHVITSLMTGGAEAMLQKLVGALAPRGIDSTVVSLTALSTIGEELDASGVPVFALGGRAGVLGPHQLVKLLRVYRRARPQVVHTWMYHANVVGHVLTRFGPGVARPALITSVRGALHAPDEQKVALRLVRGLDARLSAAADAVVFNSRRAAEQHGGIGYAMRRAVVIPNCFDTGRFRPDAAERERVRRELGCGDALLVGLVARFDRMKGHRSFLEAAGVVAARFPDCRFVMAGRNCGPTNRQLMQWIEQYGLRGRAFALGERRDVAAIHCALDVAVCSSISESFPNAIGEAMASGTPCVVTDVGDCGAIVGDTGRVVPPRDPQALAQAITELVELGGGVRAALGARARERVIREFSTDQVADRFISLYESCVGTRPGIVEPR